MRQLSILLLGCLIGCQPGDISNLVSVDDEGNRVNCAPLFDAEQNAQAAVCDNGTLLDIADPSLEVEETEEVIF